jgi:hypothetical protein
LIGGYSCDFKDRTFEKVSWNGSPEDKEHMHYFRFSNAAKENFSTRQQAGSLYLALT